MTTQPPQLVDAFLVIAQPRQRIAHWSAVLAALDSPKAPPLAKLTGYYDPANDEVILGLRYDPMALGADHLAFIVNVALLAEIGMVQPGTLSEGDRKRFVGDRLSKCTLQIDNQRSVVGALAELVRIVRDAKAAELARPSETLLGRVATRRSSGMPPLQMPAKGTRDDLAQVPREATHVNTNVNVVSANVSSRGTREQVAIRDVSSSVPPVPPVPPVVPLRAGSQPPPPPKRRLGTNDIIDDDDDPATVKRTIELPPPRKTLPATEIERASGSIEPAKQAMIYARYLRSGRWVPIRIGALSLKGAALLTGALPRLRDHVDIALAFGVNRALVRGAVTKLSTAKEASASGAAMFVVEFELDEAARRQLTALLTAARAANITIKPPPPRATRRYPVEWPVCLGTTRGAIRGHALDVSQDGMFVRPTNPLALDMSLSFSAVLDDGEAPISGRARVVRHITDATARTAGLQPGYGLNIVEMSEVDRQRWLAFVARVEARAGKRVLIGASPARLSELQAALAALGYAVTGGTDPGAIVQLARGEERPVDAALIDASWLAPSVSATWVESLFSARDVPCLTLHGDPRGARQAVDKLLLGS